MYKKRALVLGGYLSLLALAACGPKVIDDSDLVSVDYKYTFNDGTVLEEGSKDFTVGNAGDLGWIENIVRGAKQDAEFTGVINGKEIYKHDDDKAISLESVYITEAMGISDPKIGTEVHLNSMGTGIIANIEKNSDGYNSYTVEFNDPKTYSEISYFIRVTNIEKN